MNADSLKKRAVQARREYRRILSGAPDENNRLWLREDEVRARDTSAGYEPRFFTEQGLWRSSIGYARLYEDKSAEGARALFFGYHSNDLDTVKIDDPLSAEQRFALKNPDQAY